MLFRPSSWSCRVARAGFCLILATPFVVPPAFAQNTVQTAPVDRARLDQVLKGLNRGRSVAQVAVSPDGKRVAWVDGPKDGGSVMVAPIDDLKQAQRVSAAAKPDQRCQESDIAW